MIKGKFPLSRDDETDVLNISFGSAFLFGALSGDRILFVSPWRVDLRVHWLLSLYDINDIIVHIDFLARSDWEVNKIIEDTLCDTYDKVNIFLLDVTGNNVYYIAVLLTTCQE